MRTMSSADRAPQPAAIATVGPGGASCSASGAQHGGLTEAASSGCDPSGTWWTAGIAFTVGFTFRVAALYRGWEEPLAKEDENPGNTGE
jgi:hypothetical protein